MRAFCLFWSLTKSTHTISYYDILRNKIQITVQCSWIFLSWVSVQTIWFFPYRPILIICVATSDVLVKPISWKSVWLTRIELQAHPNSPKIPWTGFNPTLVEMQMLLKSQTILWIFNLQDDIKHQEKRAF